MVGEVLEEGERGNLSRYFYSFGGEILFPAFTHLVEGGLLLSFSFIG